MSCQMKKILSLSQKILHTSYIFNYPNNRYLICMFQAVEV